MRQLTISGLDARVRIEVTGHHQQAIADALRQAWSRCLRPRTGVHGGAVRVHLADELASPRRGSGQVKESDLDALLQGTTQEVTAALIKARAGQILMFHAGAVCHPRTGEALVFVAPGGTGKTTFARRLSARYGYLSDETVAVAADGTIPPYPKPLSVRRDGLPKHELSPDELGLVRAPADARIRGLVVLTRDPQVDRPRDDPLGLLDAVVALAPETSSLSKLDRGLHQLAALIEQIGPVRRWTYAESVDLEPWVEALLGSP